MELSKETQKVISGNILDSIQKMKEHEECPLPESAANVLGTCFEAIVALGSTDFLALMASLCISVLDIDLYNAVIHLNSDKEKNAINNTLMYVMSNGLNLDDHKE